MNRFFVLILAVTTSALLLVSFMFIVPEYGTLLWLRLSTLNAFKIEGVDGWRFFRGELDYVLLPWGNKAEKLSVIASYAKKNGVGLVLIPVPEKIDIYPEKLDRRLKKLSFQRNRYRRLMQELRAHQVTVVDVYDTLLSLKDRDDLFLPRETHVASPTLKLIVDKAVTMLQASNDSLTKSCLGQKKIFYSGSLEDEPATGSPLQGDSITIFTDQCTDTTVSGDTALIIGDSYAAYLSEYQGSFPDLLHARTGTFIKRISTIQPGFKLLPKIIAIIKKSPRNTTIYWIFSAREFYKPLRTPVVPSSEKTAAGCTSENVIYHQQETGE